MKLEIYEILSKLEPESILETNPEASLDGWLYLQEVVPNLSDSDLVELCVEAGKAGPYTFVFVFSHIPSVRGAVGRMPEVIPYISKSIRMSQPRQGEQGPVGPNKVSYVMDELVKKKKLKDSNVLAPEFLDNFWDNVEENKHKYFLLRARIFEMSEEQARQLVEQNYELDRFLVIFRALTYCFSQKQFVLDRIHDIDAAREHVSMGHEDLSFKEKCKIESRLDDEWRAQKEAK